MNDAIAIPHLRPPPRPLRPSLQQRRAAGARKKFSSVQLWSILGVVSGCLLFGIFLVNDSSFEVTFLLCLTWMIALVGVGLAGGLGSLIGWFTFFPFFHYLLFSMPLKALFGERIQDNLRVPETTGITLLCYFTVVAIAGLIAHRLPLRYAPLFQAPSNRRFYTLLAWSCFIIGTLAAILSLFTLSTDVDAGGQTESAGAGLVHFIAFFQNFSVGVYAYSVWKSDSGSLVRKPTFWLFLLSGTFLGLLSSGKANTTEPLAYLVMAGVCAHGFKSKSLLLTVPLFVGALMIVYPVLHYSRNFQLARTGSLSERLSLVGSVLVDYLTDSNRREQITASANDYADNQKSLYLSQSAGVFDRFMMIGNADLLIAGVSDEKQLHGYHLFKVGLELLVPRFLLADKPEGAGEEMADTAGTRNKVQASHPTWGMPASLYFSFALPGVIIGGFAVQLIFLLVLRICFGEAVRASVWFPLLIVHLNGLNSCSSVDGVAIALTYFVLFSYIVYALARFASRATLK